MQNQNQNSENGKIMPKELLKLITENVLLRNQSLKQYEEIQKNLSSVENLKQMGKARQMRAEAFILHKKISFYTFKELMMLDTASELIDFHKN